ncbi:MAG: class II aldolase/adducin family protein [Anaerolineae bacterium]|jgi:rhamnose utilization protein RhaD (predicted bifunctional aldolase and dehydrogenase)|nr:aldolase [Chloroflexota bacterium]
MSDTPCSILQALVALSVELGRPERELVILGEGNTSADAGDGTFWVKASGTQLATATTSSFVRMHTAEVCAIAERSSCDDAQFKALLESARVDKGDPRRPSVETVLHALALHEMGVRYIAHTHPVAVNAVLCSEGAEQAVSGRLFPDEIVVCGPAPAYVPYVDPGFELAAVVRATMRRYADAYGMAPKLVLMQNHGMIALGASPQEVDNITAMAVKTFRVLSGTFSLGGPCFLTQANVDRIHTRPDELYRRKALAGQ